MLDKQKDKKIAVVLFNLGGPDSPKAIKSFLFNLFYDKHIIDLPNPWRWLIAKLISNLRAKTAKNIYSHTGNKSPILVETKKQQEALTDRLTQVLDANLKVFICMRHWHPMAGEAVAEIIQYNPSEILLLPLYPQFSTTTTGSSINDFIAALNKHKKNIKVKQICCYPTVSGLINGHVHLISNSLTKLKSENFRLLFSAHGLPLKTIKAGDPYQWQVQQTVKEVVEKLQISNLDYKLTYQSRVGPLKWLQPNTEEEIQLAASEGKALIIVPISFVSEHVETLVELDIEYGKIASKYSVEYIRVPALSINEHFIDALSRLVIETTNTTIAATRICPQNFSKCIFNS